MIGEREVTHWVSVAGKWFNVILSTACNLQFTFCWACVSQGLDYHKYPALVVALKESTVQRPELLQKVAVRLLSNFDCSEFPLMEIA